MRFSKARASMPTMPLIYGYFENIFFVVGMLLVCCLLAFKFDHLVLYQIMFLLFERMMKMSSFEDRLDVCCCLSSRNLSYSAGEKYVIFF